MNIKKVFFWLHLILGCSAAVFILLMSLTGVALTYERQMIHAAERADYPVSSTAALSVDEMVTIAEKIESKKVPDLIFSSEVGAPVVVKQGRKALAYLNPYSGERMAVPGESTKIFFSKLRGFHRWLTLDGKFSQTGRWFNGYANVFFVVLILSGIYLWLPLRKNKRAFKQKLTLTKKHVNTTARNYQWHNVFGIYMMPALLVIAITATFFSFKWPGEQLKNMVSTQTKALPKPAVLAESETTGLLSHQQLLATLTTQYPEWQKLSFSLAKQLTDVKIFKLDLGNGGEPQKRLSVVVDTRSGVISEQQTFDQLSTYSQVRSYIRFLHTGEAYGLVGQTIAGIASLLACLLVYTGIMLSWRRWLNSRATKAAALFAPEKLAPAE